MRDIPASDIGGVSPPNAPAGVRYVQAQFSAINQHRISGGIGMRDVLPGVDFNINAGGMFDANEQLGATAVSLKSYWVGAGTTWRFGRGARKCKPASCD